VRTLDAWKNHQCRTVSRATSWAATPRIVSQIWGEADTLGRQQGEHGERIWCRD